MQGSSYAVVAGTNPWKPGVLNRFPWFGFLMILGTILGMVASAAILVYSNNEPITAWKYQPATFLALASTLTNICLIATLREGADIAWWTRAMRKSNKMVDLHRAWSSGNSFLGAVQAGKAFNIIGLSCILATIAQINGPLLQRASKVVLQTQALPVSIQMRLGSAIPQGSTGYISGRGYNVSLFTADYGRNVVQAWNTNTSIPANGTSCQGMCSTRVEGIGLSVNCTAATVPFNLTVPENQDELFAAGGVVAGITAFQTSLRWSPSDTDHIELSLLYKGTSDCEGVLQLQNCTLRPARVIYPVLVDGNKSTIVLAPKSTVFDDTVMDVITYPVQGAMAGPTTLGGFYLALKNKFVSMSTVRFVGAVGYEVMSSNNLATQYAVVNGSYSDTSFAIGSSCHVAWTNPLEDILAGARDLMFRTAINAANSTTPLQTVSAVESRTRAVFHTNYAYLVAGIAVTLIALIVTLGCFKGYQQLGRGVTMSPLELAKAFDPAILRNKDSNAPVKQLIEEFGGKSAVYGAQAGQARSSFVSNDETSYQNREDKIPIVSETESLDGPGKMKLTMGNEDQIVTPRKGFFFSG